MKVAVAQLSIVRFNIALLMVAVAGMKSCSVEKRMSGLKAAPLFWSETENVAVDPQK